MTSLGWTAFGLPALVGICLVLWSFVTARTPRMRTAGFVSAAVAATLLVVGLWSISAAAGDDDASIGGGLLVLSSVPTAVGSVALLRTVRTRSS